MKTVKLAAGTAGLATLGLAFHETGAPSPKGALVRNFDFSVATPGPKLAIAHGRDRAKLLGACLQELGGLSRFIAPQDRVLLKVNAGFASPPEIGATTHPDLLAAMIQLCRQAGAERILVSDNPISDPATCFSLNGLASACQKNGAELLLPGPRDFAQLTLPGGRLIRDWPVMLGALTGVNKVIGLAPVKDHIRAKATMGIKNWYGVLGGRRGVFHQDIHQIVLELAMLVRPTLSVVDGVQTMMHNGPTGGSLDDLADTQTMIVGVDPIAADAAAVSLLGLRAQQVEYLNLCQAAGLGTLDIIGLNPREMSL